MIKQIVTINGRQVFSDKQMASVVNTRVIFSDGSWCDVVTGEVVNKGAGYINIDTLPTVGDTEKMTHGPKMFSTKNLNISNIIADVEVSVIDGDQMIVTIDGAKSEISGIEVKQDGNTLLVQGDGGKSNTRGANVVISGISSSVSINGNNINIGHGRANTSACKLLIGVPKVSAVHVDGVQGKIVIGDTEGLLHASALCNKIKVGKVRDATLSVQGSGNIDVGVVDGNLSMNVQGSGSISVRNGSVNQIFVNVMGSGDARFGGEAVNANLSLMGSGDIDVKFIENKPITNIVGSGGINVGNW